MKSLKKLRILEVPKYELGYEECLSKDFPNLESFECGARYCSSSFISESILIPQVCISSITRNKMKGF